MKMYVTITFFFSRDFLLLRLDPLVSLSEYFPLPNPAALHEGLLLRPDWRTISLLFSFCFAELLSETVTLLR